MISRFFVLPALLSAAFALPARAQTPLACSGLVSDGSQTAQDFLIPNVPGSVLRLALSGGDGGTAAAGDCDATGGQGATATATFRIGTGTGELRPGGVIRFIIGERGQDASNPLTLGSGRAAAGGGGGTGVLFDALGDGNWVPLLIAGGGGGGRQRTSVWICLPNDTQQYKFGLPGNTGECGTSRSGSRGGCDGQAGSSWRNGRAWGAGGGLYSSAGSTHGGAGLPAGGAGGEG